MIFPTKSDYFEKINFDELDEVVIEKGIYVDYLMKSSSRPMSFYHCFSQLFFINENFYLHLHFGVNIFYEEIKVKSDSFNLEEKTNLRGSIIFPKKNEEKILPKQLFSVSFFLFELLCYLRIMNASKNPPHTIQKDVCTKN